MMIVAAATAIEAAQSSARAVWIDTVNGDVAVCVAQNGQWICPNRSATAVGTLIEIERDHWGRLLQVTAGSAADADLHHVAVTAWRPERSAVRTQQQRFRAIRDDAVRVVRLSATRFWLSGQGTSDPDAFLSIDGPAISAIRLSTRRIAEGVVEAAVVVAAPIAASVSGHIRDARGGDVARAAVELLQPLHVDVDPREPMTAETPVIARAMAVTDDQGTFVFDRSPDPPFLVMAASAISGRGSTWVTEFGSPADIVLVPPLRAVGRVLRNRLPVAGARVHFVPTLAAWAASADPMANLSEDALSAADGTFELTLPERHLGELQVIAQDGAMTRRPILDAADARRNPITVGDISIPEPLRVVVRVLEAFERPACDLIAIGPLGKLGLQTVRASSAVNVYTLDLPESGQWTFTADCGGRTRSVVPIMATIPPPTPGAAPPTIDVHFAR